MKQLIRLMGVVFACGALGTTAFAGTETYSGKEMKQVAPAPPPMCEWGGFYVGLHAGGQFGHSETAESFTVEGLGMETGPKFGYSESGFNGGGEFGYNWQWNWLVLGPEFDVGYMNLEGRGTPATGFHGETDSDFYTTLRGRIGVALDWHGCWLIYGTGGAIGTNYTTRFHIDSIDFDARTSDFDWGYTVGGGIERKLTPHWSVKAEYLYFSLDDQSFQNTRTLLIADEFRTFTGRFTGETFGHIIRAGLNYKF